MREAIVSKWNEELRIGEAVSLLSVIGIMIFL